MPVSRVNKVVKITACSDQFFWYRAEIGQYYIVDRIEVEGEEVLYWTREPSGYRNFILAKDCEVIDE